MKEKGIIILNRKQLSGCISVRFGAVNAAIANGLLPVKIRDLKGSPLFNFDELSTIEAIFKSQPKIEL